MLISLLQDLIRIPSENNGVTGYENDVQLFYHGWLKRHGINAELIYPETMPGFDTMPGRLPEHEMRNRPLVLASLKGSRPGKRRLLLAHADTVPVGELSAWSDSPFSGKLENGRIYGRGQASAVEDRISLVDTEISLRKDGPIGKVYLAPTRQELLFEQKDGYCTVRIPLITGYGLVVFESLEACRKS